jgi:hypothetical protein
MEPGVSIGATNADEPQPESGRSLQAWRKHDCVMAAMGSDRPQTLHWNKKARSGTRGLKWSKSKEEVTRLPPTAAELVVQAGGEHADAAIVDADYVASEGSARTCRHALVLQPNIVVFGSR